MTERVYHAFLAGCVPVYAGARAKSAREVFAHRRCFLFCFDCHVSQFLPCAHCAIFIEDFASPRELAQYLIYLDQHDDEYVKYLAWKLEPMHVPMSMVTTSRT